LFAFRAWLPAYLLFAWNRTAGGQSAAAVTRWSMLIVLIGVPASIIGAEVADPGVRNRMLWRFEDGSVAIAELRVVAGHVSPGWRSWRSSPIAFCVAINADSGALTAGAVASARPDEQGATLAICSLAGFVGGAIGPLVVGVALD
jgi:CDP-diglyceride synthetase